jgi:hypothetical protein
MNVKEKLDQLLNDVEGSSGEYYIQEKIIQKKYLVGGELKEWKGDFQPVFSPVCEVCGNQLERKMIGAYPLLTESVSIDVLESSIKAYDHGRGVWPSMTVEERIECMETFIFKCWKLSPT